MLIIKTFGKNNDYQLVVKPTFCFRIKMMAETGMLARIERMYTPSDVCSEVRKERTDAHTLSIYEVVAAFVVLFAGLGISAFVILIEVLSMYKRIK